MDLAELTAWAVEAARFALAVGLLFFGTVTAVAYRVAYVREEGEPWRSRTSG